ncbi:hypothetical protein RDI58_012943 [Solanum bulbocastanum]|uniref:Uncharacterized protein n=1 Tax=Solanum bulbocastanum TaxID=147425 RepID=A0AAN8YDJ1_SOLBU
MGERNDSSKLFGIVISSDNHNEGSGSRMKRNRWTEEEEEDRGILIDESEKSRDHSNNKMGERNHSIKLFGVVISSYHHNEDSGSRKKRSRWTDEEEEENWGILVDEREKSGDDLYNKGKWSEEEHNSFLIGLDKVGKGNWNRIAKQFVPSRSSAQVASHAQNFFGRHNKNRAALHGASSQSSISVSLDNLDLTL